MTSPLDGYTWLSAPMLTNEIELNYSKMIIIVAVLTIILYALKHAHYGFNTVQQVGGFGDFIRLRVVHHHANKGPTKEIINT